MTTTKRTLSLLCVALLALCVVAETTEADDQRKVLNLDTETWRQTLDDNQFVVVLFNQPTELGCQECLIAAAEFPKVLNLLQDTSVVVAQVDCKSSKKICDDEEITNDVPFIRLFERDLSSFDYPRYKVFATHVEEFVRQYLGPKFSVLETTEEIDAFARSHKTSIVGFFSLGENKIISSFKRTASRLFQDLPFALVMISSDNVAFLEKNDILPGSVVMFKFLGGSLSRSTYDGAITRKRVTRWIHENVPWMVNEVTKENGGFGAISKGRIPILALYIDPSDVSRKDLFVNELEKIVERFRGALTFAVKIISEEDQEFITTYGLSGRSSPILVIHDLRDTLVFLHAPFSDEHPLDSNEISDWSLRVLRRKVAPYHYKQPIPQQDSEAAVKILVTDNFRRFVDADISSIIFFYLPQTQCNHCYKFLEVFEQIAAKLQSSHKLPVQFGKVDMSANQRVPGYSVSTFPSIHFFPKANKNRTTHFLGKRDEETLTQWILSLFPSDTPSEKSESIKSSEIL